MKFAKDAPEQPIDYVNDTISGPLAGRGCKPPEQQRMAQAPAGRVAVCAVSPATALLGEGPRSSSHRTHSSGNAKTKSPLPPFGRRFSGVSSSGIVVQLPPPMPVGSATYCLPSTA